MVVKNNPGKAKSHIQLTAHWNVPPEVIFTIFTCKPYTQPYPHTQTSTRTESHACEDGVRCSAGICSPCVNFLSLRMTTDPDNSAMFRDVHAIGHRSVVVNQPGYKEVRVEQIHYLKVRIPQSA